MNDLEFQLPTVEGVSKFRNETENQLADPASLKLNALLESKEFKETDATLPIALGMTDDGQSYVTDLATLPHLLIGGKAGYGKSIFLNGLITSLLYKKRPDEIKFVFFDPKMVEFFHYESIENQYLAKVPGEEAIITDMAKVMPTLNSLLLEMNNRLRMLKDAKVRNFNEYNSLLKSGKLKTEEGQTPMPYLVVIVDELVDLMLSNGHDASRAFSLLARNGRIVGIHLVLASNDPSAYIVPGNMKSSIHGRIAFRVTNAPYSKDIINSTDAKDLTKPGEMIFENLPEKNHLQCGYISTEEVKALCDYIASQPFTGTEPYLLPIPTENEI